MSRSRSSPAPYRSVTTRTSSSARSRARSACRPTVPGGGAAAMASISASIRSPVVATSGGGPGDSSAGAWVLTARGSADAGGLGRGVHDLELLARPQVHVHAAGQARVEAADGAHDVDALEVLPVVLLEDRLTLHGVLVGARRAEAVAGVGVPRRRR